MQISPILRYVALLCLSTGVESAKKVEVKESLIDSAVADMQWFGDKQQIVLVQTTRGRLYRSTNGGSAWQDITDKLKGVSGSVEKIVKSPSDPLTVMVAGSKKTHFLSTDGGEKFKKIRQKATIHTFLFHKTRPKWALMSTWTAECEPGAKRKKKSSDDDDDDKDDDDSPDNRPCNHLLYITKDMGKTFSQVASYIVQFSWGDKAHRQEDRIYYTHYRKKSGDQPKLHLWSEGVDFSYSDNQGRTSKRLLYKGNKFIVTNGFIMVVKLKDAVSQAVNLMISSSGGASFNMAKLPEEIDEKSYTVLDTSEGVIMLHVNHGAREGGVNVGSVYVSDKEGIRFSLSLPNNVRGSNGDCEFDKVQSLEGIYMANFKDSMKPGESLGVGSKKAQRAQEDEDEEKPAQTAVQKRHQVKAKKDESVVRTVISFDKGGLWSYLKPPKVDSVGKKIDCPKDRCWLHLHGITNFHNYAPFYSTEQAVGIIMGTGNVGSYLRHEPEETNTYISRDGGLTWVEAHKGAFIYEFGDHGGLVVMADDVKKTKQVVFSWNEGQSWYDFELSEYPIEVDNVVTEPNATSTKFVLYGTRGGSGVLYHLDFDALGQPSCKGVWAADSVSSDYETWMPSDGRSNSEKCVLGKQVTYTRRKPTSECFNGELFEPPSSKKSCACTEEDYECEMGFVRKIGDLRCQYTEDGSVPIPKRCASEEDFKAVAYRKVAGDSCSGGWRPEMATIPCPRSAKLTKGAASVLSSFVMVGSIMALIYFLSHSEQFRAWFANNGFASFNSVKYTTIGDLAPETGLDSVGELDDDSFEPRGRKIGAGRERDRRESEMHSEPTVRRIDTAADKVPQLQKPPGSGAVPKLQKPPGSGAAGPAGDDDGMDLL